MILPLSPCLDERSPHTGHRSRGSSTVTALVGDVDPGFTPETPPALGFATVAALVGDVDPGFTPETPPVVGRGPLIDENVY